MAMIVDDAGRAANALARKAISTSEKQAREGTLASSSRRRPSTRVTVVTWTTGVHRVQARGGSESPVSHSVKFRPIFRAAGVA